MMLTPWGPSAVPTGGAGVAAPAWSCTLTSAAIFFLGGMGEASFAVVRRGHREPDRLCHLGVAVLRVVLRNRTIVVAGSPEAKSAVPSVHRSSRLDAQTRWTWLKLSSTGVSRPKISTSALTR